MLIGCNLIRKDSIILQMPKQSALYSIGDPEPVGVGIRGCIGTSACSSRMRTRGWMRNLCESSKSPGQGEFIFGVYFSLGSYQHSHPAKIFARWRMTQDL